MELKNWNDYTDLEKNVYYVMLFVIIEKVFLHFKNMKIMKIL